MGGSQTDVARIIFNILNQKDLTCHPNLKYIKKINKLINDIKTTVMIRGRFLNKLLLD